MHILDIPEIYSSFNKYLAIYVDDELENLNFLQALMTPDELGYLLVSLL